MTITYQTLINEINKVPVIFLQDVYNIIHSYNSATVEKHEESNKKNILKFAGSWSAIPDKEYDEIMSKIENTKSEMFSREVKL